MNIVLIGYRGTGKSEVGKILSQELGWPVIHFDRQIVEKADLSIPELVKLQGWEYFRDLETEVTREYSQQDQSILDTGGGCILREENVDALKKNGTLFLLEASVEVIAERIGDDTQRPSLSGDKSFIEEISDILAERQEKYRAVADHIINTDFLSIRQTAEKIIVILSGAKDLMKSVEKQFERDSSLRSE